jgi:two-component system sensor histidine kinase TctE
MAERRRRRASLQRRLFGWLMLPVLAALPLLGLLIYNIVQHNAQAWLDEALGDTALAVAGQVDTRGGEPRLEITAGLDIALRFDRQDEVYYLVVGPNGQLLQGDAGLLDAAPAALPLAANAWAYDDVNWRGRSLRRARLGQSCGTGVCQVMVAETLNKRAALEGEIALVVGASIAALAVLLGGAGWLAIRQGLGPLAELSAEVEQRDLHRLDPLSAEVPRELVPLRKAFNRLFERLALAADAQREFLADAAHQLRTPLTSLQTEIELAIMEPHDERVAPLLTRLRQRVTRSARLAQQLLSLARSEARTDASGADAHAPVDLRDIAAWLGEDWAHRDLPAGMDLGFDLQPAPALGQAFLLRELLENLVHNAVTYAGPTATITVRCGQSGGQSWIEVEDNGPGIPPSERAAALQRFRRGAVSKGSGSGLGLAIAAGIAQRHGGVLQLLDALEGPGLRARLSLPALKLASSTPAS